MKKSILIVLWLFFNGITTGIAQESEIGFFVGTASYRGDLSQKLIDLNNTSIGLGGFYRLPVNNLFSVRVAMNYGNLSGGDQDSEDLTIVRRNLSFRTRIWEGSAQLMVHLFGGNVSDKPSTLDPYIFMGIGVFNFNPEAQYEGEWYALQPLGTEGQGVTANSPQKYRLNELAVPAGIGLRFRSGGAWQVGFEMAFRLTFTDYIDDLSSTYPDIAALREANGELAAALSDRSGEINNGVNVFTEGDIRGNPAYNDGYWFIGLNLGYQMMKKAKYDCYKF